MGLSANSSKEPGVAKMAEKEIFTPDYHETQRYINDDPRQRAFFDDNSFKGFSTSAFMKNNQECLQRAIKKQFHLRMKYGIQDPGYQHITAIVKCHEDMIALCKIRLEELRTANNNAGVAAAFTLVGYKTDMQTIGAELEWKDGGHIVLPDMYFDPTVMLQETAYAQYEFSQMLIAVIHRLDVNGARDWTENFRKKPEIWGYPRPMNWDGYDFGYGSGMLYAPTSADFIG
ncbi:hypothetical protein K505DRAFT_337762 [Melanomma pulvis-pyrius CBS 109.77]|uniref:Uncharacterized protein n=1 Tax=Melanomma pulvis-pyrius CBS 109.77 TaxID=1314802 RepID=A0A6A6XAC3_9PLEO|nr:hypothetical protein K505DRAFT_337762 [Melanomma pulvis-pyrius CBS 109.77]